MYKKSVQRLAFVLVLATFVPLVRAQQQPAAAQPDISGMYTFLHEGEFVQLNMEQTGLSGYISRLGIDDSDRDAFLDHFFSKAELKGDDISFTTKMVHSMWYEFKGRVERGSGKKPGDDDYYELVGTLTEHIVSADKHDRARQREVTFKAFPTSIDKDTKP